MTLQEREGELMGCHGITQCVIRKRLTEQKDWLESQRNKMNDMRKQLSAVEIGVAATEHEIKILENDLAAMSDG